MLSETKRKSCYGNSSYGKSSLVNGGLTLRRVLLAGLSLLFASPSFSAPSDFPRPEQIKPAIDFWTRVYAEIDTQSGYLHDRENLGIVYEYLPLNRGDTPRQQQRDIDSRTKQYQRLLLSMAETDSSRYSAEQLRVARLFGVREPSSDVLKMAAKRVRFQRGQSDRFKVGLGREQALAAQVKPVFESMGLPKELALLPHVESSYNHKVRSRVGALGLWQLMPETARRYIKVSDQIDQRLDVKLATKAAAQLLQHNYKVTGDWSLAVLAYNRGLGGVRRAMRESASEDIGEIIQNYRGKNFGFASRNFYPAFLAAVDVSSQNGKLPAGPGGPSMVLSSYLHAYDIAEEYSLSTVELRMLNPQISMQVWNGEKLLSPGSTLNLPLHLQARAEPALRSLEALLGRDQQIDDRYYRVRSGDKLTLLARDLGTDLGALMQRNGVRSKHRIYAGQILRLPLADFPLPPIRSRFANLESRSGVSKARLQKERPLLLSSLSRGVTKPIAPGVHWNRYFTSSLQRAGTSVSVGPGSVSAFTQSLRTSLQFAEQAPMLVADRSSLGADPADYRVDAQGRIEVQEGETIGHYAQWLDVSSAELRRLNKLRKRQNVVVGRRLNLALANIDSAEFEARRKAHHVALQNAFFSRYRIAGTQSHALGRGDSLWELAIKEYRIPLWLLRQFNPEVDMTGVLALNTELEIPVLEPKTS